MSLREITDQAVEQACDACGRVRIVELQDIQIGTTFETDGDKEIDAEVIPLPKCDQCGAVEFLIPTAEDAPEYPAQGSFGHKHAILVDVLYDRLLKGGRVATGIEASGLKKKKRTEQEINRWFEKGMKLEDPFSREPASDDKSNKNKETSDVQ